MQQTSRITESKQQLMHKERRGQGAHNRIQQERFTLGKREQRNTLGPSESTAKKLQLT